MNFVDKIHFRYILKCIFFIKKSHTVCMKSIFQEGYMTIYKRCYFIFLIGATGYCLLEFLWRGYTHPSMGIAGGICLIGIHYINIFLEKYSRFLRAIICSIMITVTEFLFGIILNLILNLNIWDYSDLPFNFMGQICIQFSTAWFFISYVLIFMIDKSKFANHKLEHKRKEHG